MSQAQIAVVPTGHWWLGLGRGLLGLAVPGLLAALLLYGALIWRFDWTGQRFGWRNGLEGVRAFGAGLAWGGVMAGAALLLTVAGGARLTVQAAPGESYLRVAGPVLIGLALAALLEELLFRGFPLARLADAAGRVTASVVLALVFAVAHLGNPETSGLGIVNIGLAALLLGAVFFSPGGLPAAWGLHLGWNGGLVLAGDAPVSGLRFALPAIEYSPGRHAWMTGGSFGPEGGLVTTIVMTGALVWWVRRGLTETGEVA